MIRTKWIDGDRNLDAAIAIRKEVFIREQNVPQDIEIDGTDAYALHLVVFDDSLPVATGRILKTGDEFVLGRIAVLKEHRGLGYGDLVVRMLIRRAYEMGADKQIIHSQLHASGFYEKLGFKRFGEEYSEAGIPHINMIHEGDITGNCG